MADVSRLSWTKLRVCERECEAAEVVYENAGTLGSSTLGHST